MKPVRLVAAAILLFGLALPAQAAGVVYLPGLRVGLVPLDGLTAAQGFPGFEDADKGLKVLVREMPMDMFATIDAAVKSDQPLPADVARPESFQTTSGRKSYLAHETKTTGDIKTSIYSLILGAEGFSGFVAVEVPEKAMQTYPEPAIRSMLASTTVRAEVPVDEQLASLPFKVTETAGFKTIRTIPPGGAVLFSDATDNSALGGPPYMVVSLAPATPASNDDRGRLARELAQTIPGIKNVRYTNAEPIRIGGRPGYEVRIEAVAAKDEKQVSLVQWLRFGSGAMLRMVASANREDWPQAFPRFRAVRDGINPVN